MMKKFTWRLFGSREKKDTYTNKTITDTVSQDTVEVLKTDACVDESVDYGKLPSLEKLTDVQKAFVDMFDVFIKKGDRDNAFEIAAKGKLPREFYLYAMKQYSTLEEEKIQKEKKDREGKTIVSCYMPSISWSIVSFFKEYLLPANIFTKEQMRKYLASMTGKAKERDEEQNMIRSIGYMIGDKSFMEQYYDKVSVDSYIAQLLTIEKESEKVYIYTCILKTMQECALDIFPEEKKKCIKMKISYGLQEDKKNGKKRNVDDIVGLAQKLWYELDESDKKQILDVLLKDLRIGEIMEYIQMYGDKQLRRKLFLAIADRRTNFWCIKSLLLGKDEIWQNMFSPQELQSIAEELLKKWCIEIVLIMINSLKYDNIILDVDALIATAQQLGYVYDAKKIAEYTKKEMPEQKLETPEEMRSAIQKLFGSILPYVHHQSQWDRYSMCLRKSDELKAFDFFPEPQMDEYAYGNNDKLYMYMSYPANEESFKNFMEQHKDVLAGEGDKELQKKFLQVLKIIRAYVPVMAIARAHEKVNNIDVSYFNNSPVRFSDSTVLNYIRRQYLCYSDSNLWCNEFTRYKYPSDCGCCKETNEMMYRYRISHLIKKEKEERAYKIPDEVIDKKVLEMLTGEERKRISIVDELIQKYDQ